MQVRGTWERESGCMGRRGEGREQQKWGHIHIDWGNGMPPYIFITKEIHDYSFSLALVYIFVPWGEREIGGGTRDERKRK